MVLKVASAPLADGVNPVGAEKGPGEESIAGRTPSDESQALPAAGRPHRLSQAALAPQTHKEVPAGIPGVTQDGEFTFETPTGGQGRVSRRSEHSQEPAPPLTDQAVGLIEHPETIPLPQCWGLPPCEQIPENIDL